MLWGLDPSMLIGFLYKTGWIFDAEWQRYAAVMLCTVQRHPLTGRLGYSRITKPPSIVDGPPSWSDADDSFESMSDRDEEDGVLKIRILHRARVWAMGTPTRTRAKTRRKSTDDFSMLAKAQSSAIGPRALHQRAARAVAAQRTIR